jgi:hypothetical protein
MECLPARNRSVVLSLAGGNGDKVEDVELYGRSDDWVFS